MTNDGSADQDCEIIALDEHAALCLAADETGSPLLPALVEGTTLEKLVASISERYASAPEALAEDVDRLLANLHDKGSFRPRR